MGKVKVGKIDHYFSKIGVAVLDLEAPLKVGDKISIEGSSTNFEQTVDSIQIDKKNIEEAKAGDSIGMSVKEKVREKDIVYKIEE